MIAATLLTEAMGMLAGKVAKGGLIGGRSKPDARAVVSRRCVLGRGCRVLGVMPVEDGAQFLVNALSHRPICDVPVIAPGENLNHSIAAELSKRLFE